MSEELPAPPRRPATARPRHDGEHEPAPPSRAELEAVERQLAELATYSGASVSDDPSLGALLVRQPRFGPGLNFAACVRWPPHELAERLSALEDRLRGAGEWPALVIAEGLSEPPGLARSLDASGWLELERERVMWTRLPPSVPHLDPSLRVEAATSRSAGEYERLEREIFGLAAQRARERTERLSEALEGGRLRAFLVRLRGEVVATARLAPGNGVAGIFGVGVAASHRRAGYGSLVTAIATRAGLAAGNRLVWLSVDEQNTPAERLYRKLGYRPSFAWSRWVAAAAPGPC